jgi:hypothetical protein
MSKAMSEFIERFPECEFWEPAEWEWAHDVLTFVMGCTDQENAKVDEALRLINARPGH